MIVCNLNTVDNNCYNSFYVSNSSVCGVDVKTNTAKCFSDYNDFTRDFFTLDVNNNIVRFIDKFEVTYFDYLSYTALSAVLLGFSFVFLSSFLAILIGRR